MFQLQYLAMLLILSVMSTEKYQVLPGDGPDLRDPVSGHGLPTPAAVGRV